MQVDDDSTEHEIKAAYRQLAKVCHPDFAGEAGHNICILLNEVSRPTAVPSRSKSNRSGSTYICSFAHPSKPSSAALQNVVRARGSVKRELWSWSACQQIFESLVISRARNGVGIAIARTLYTVFWRRVY